VVTTSAVAKISNSIRDVREACVRIIPLRGAGVAWFKCPACRLKCRPTAVGPDGQCPRCGQTRMLKLSFGFGVRATTPAPDADHE
jgi:DNA-directed RNA polymerase subunit RPC12/RpoP